MTNFSTLALQEERMMFARAELIKEMGLDWWPTVWLNLLPATENRKAFTIAVANVKKIMADDVAAVLAEAESPWEKKGPPARLINNEGMGGVELMALGMDRMLGFPAPVKHGDDPDGVPYVDHPDVKEAQANAHRTAEWVAHIESIRAQREWEKASRAYVHAANNGADAKEVKKLQDESDARQRAYNKATKAMEKLRNDPKRGLKIVRAAMTDEEIFNESESLRPRKE